MIHYPPFKIDPHFQVAAVLTFGALLFIAGWIQARRNQNMQAPCERKKVLPSTEIDNVKCRSQFIEKKLQAAKNEEDLWAIVGLIGQFERDFIDDINAYSEARLLKRKYDRKVEQLFSTVA